MTEQDQRTPQPPPGAPDLDGGTRALTSRLARAIGRPLRSVQALVHVFRGSLSDDPGHAAAIGLLFEDEPRIWLQGDDDGAALEVLEVAPEPYELGLDGEWVLREAAHRYGFGALVGRAVVAVEVLETDGAATGLTLDFGDGKRRCIWIAADELRVGERAAAESPSEE